MVSVIRKAPAFEVAVEYLKQRRLQMATKESGVQTPEEHEVLRTAENVKIKECNKLPNGTMFRNLLPSVKRKDEARNVGSTNARIATNIQAEATAQSVKKPLQAFGSLLGNPEKRQHVPDRRKHETSRSEQIKSSSSGTALGRNEPFLSGAKISTIMSETSSCRERVTGPATHSDIVVLYDVSDA